MTILVTGSNGMIGSHVVKRLLDNGFIVIGIDRRDSTLTNERYIHHNIDLFDINELESIFNDYIINRVIHLAALAHTAGEVDLSYKQYYKVNVICAQNIFHCAAKRQIPILFISTTDVYGFVKGIATVGIEPKPITIYGKTKYIAEIELKNICMKYDCKYSIYRFAPVYTDHIKRDIQKRYYIKYPNLAFIIGKGIEYEFLYIKMLSMHW
jgi:nucleoside-diphosphate-sugar epimerase